ncbi:MAG: hypothetical protein LQ351_003001 [Letrouitia transgressa]|nr:MAG: hypothetical protein LQ351_003001 [Letrouitia transgressa]
MAPSPLLSDAGDTGSLNYTVLVPYNESNPTGGDSLKNNLNVHYQSGDIAWLLVATPLVLLMIPGVG